VAGSVKYFSGLGRSYCYLLVIASFPDIGKVILRRVSMTSVPQIHELEGTVCKKS
jgi:hypothetical protein